MLSLTRKIGESIVIDTASGPIVVKVIAVDRNKVRLGIGADRSVTILRAELTNKPARDKR